MSDKLRVHDVMDRSLANGPGARAVLWLQGCSLGCPGCFNPATHSPRGGRWVSVDELFSRIARGLTDIEGLTVSGGEPLEQSGALEALLQLVRRNTGLSIILFTGYSWHEINASPDKSKILPLLDVVIAGRYNHDRRIARGLRGSSNQSVHFMTTRYSQKDLDLVPAAEIMVDGDGAIVVSGIDPPTALGGPERPDPAIHRRTHAIGKPGCQVTTVRLPSRQSTEAKSLTAPKSPGLR